jgi:hypothetical protein
MNGWGFLSWLVSVAAVFSLPLVLLASLMRLVGRISTRALVVVLAADAVLCAMALVCWWGRG